MSRNEWPEISKVREGGNVKHEWPDDPKHDWPELKEQSGGCKGLDTI